MYWNLKGFIMTGRARIIEMGLSGAIFRVVVRF